MTSGGRTKEANERSFVFVHQHGGENVTSKPPIRDMESRIQLKPKWKFLNIVFLL